jgi:hypothetical protein
MSMGALTATSGTINGPVEIGTGADKTSINSGAIGFNRRTYNGAIYDNTGYAYQWQHTKSTTAASDYLALEVYNPSGTQITTRAILFDGNGNTQLSGTLSATSVNTGGSTGFKIWTYNGGAGLPQGGFGQDFFGGSRETAAIISTVDLGDGSGSFAIGARRESDGVTSSALFRITSSGAATFASSVSQSPVAFASLPTGSAGMRHFVNNNSSGAAFGSAANGSGSTTYPVYHDGVSWKIG